MTVSTQLFQGKINKSSIIKSFLTDCWDNGEIPYIQFDVSSKTKSFATTANGTPFDIKSFSSNNVLTLNLSVEAIGRFYYHGEGEEEVISVETRFNGKVVTSTIHLSDVLGIFVKDKGTSIGFIDDNTVFSEIPDNFKLTNEELRKIETETPVFDPNKISAIGVDMNSVIDVLPVIESAMLEKKEPWMIELLHEENGVIRSSFVTMDTETRIVIDEDKLYIGFIPSVSSNPNFHDLEFVEAIFDLKTKSLTGIFPEETESSPVTIKNIFTPPDGRGQVKMHFNAETGSFIINDPDIIHALVGKETTEPVEVDKEQERAPAEVLDFKHKDKDETSTTQTGTAQVIDFAAFRNKGKK